MRPEVEIEAFNATQALVRNGSHTFTARLKSKNTQGLSFEWGHLAGDCPVPLDTSMPATTPSPSPTWVYRPEPSHVGKRCIWVLVKDKQGASGHAFTTIEVTNQAPSATLTRIAPPPAERVPLGSLVSIQPSIKDPDPEDKVQSTFTLLPPRGDAVSLMPCPDAADNLWCFHATMPGVWKLSLVATDSLGTASEPATLDVIVEEDQPPCAHVTPDSPALVHDASLPLLLEVRVADDLDALPSSSSTPSQASFRWSVLENAADGWLVAVDSIDRAFRVPANRFRPADTLRVRVDIADRMPRTPAPECTSDSDECALVPACKQRFTWTVAFR